MIEKHELSFKQSCLYPKGKKEDENEIKQNKVIRWKLRMTEKHERSFKQSCLYCLKGKKEDENEIKQIRWKWIITANFFLNSSGRCATGASIKGGRSEGKGQGPLAAGTRPRRRALSPAELLRGWPALRTSIIYLFFCLLIFYLANLFVCLKGEKRVQTTRFHRKQDRKKKDREKEKRQVRQKGRAQKERNRNIEETVGKERLV